ncbi:hypothetical protein GQ457_02G030360 [Hibiscus cannabinus]
MQKSPREETYPPKLDIVTQYRINSENILFCMDVDSESLVEMKTAGVNRLDAIKQAILLFVNSKLSINPDHRFAFATLSKFTYWHIKEFNSDVECTIAVVRALSATIVSSSQLDLTNLFRLAAHEAKKSHSQNRILRVVSTQFFPFSHQFLSLVVGTAKMNAVIKVFAIMSLANVDAFMDLVISPHAIVEIEIFEDMQLVLRYQNRVQNLCFTFLFVLRAVTKRVSTFIATETTVGIDFYRLAYY